MSKLPAAFYSDDLTEWWNNDVQRWKQSLHLDARAAPSEGVVSYLKNSLSLMMEARKSCIDDLRNLLTLALVLFLASGYVAGLALNSQGRDSWLLSSLSAFLLVVLFPTVFFGKRKFDAAYHMYAATTIHAALVHAGAGLPETHNWFTSVRECVGGVPTGGASLDWLHDWATPDIEYPSELNANTWKFAVIVRWKMRYNSNVWKTGMAYFGLVNIIAFSLLVFGGTALIAILLNRP